MSQPLVVSVTPSAHLVGTVGKVECLAASALCPVLATPVTPAAAPFVTPALAPPAALLAFES